MKQRNRVALLALAMGLLPVANASNSIDVPSGGTHSLSIYGDGRGGDGWSALGQSFTTGSSPDLQLNTFSFWVAAVIDRTHPGKPTLQAGLYEWGPNNSGSQLLGNRLNPISQKTLPDSNFKKLSFDTGGVLLKANTTYFAFLTTLGNGDGLVDVTSFGANETGNPNPINGDIYRVTWSNVNTVAGLNTAHWSHYDGYPNVDLAFSASFTQPVPEPQTYAMLLAGLAVVGWRARSRRRG